MPDYSAPLQQMRFTIEHLADFKDVAALQAYSAVDADTVEAVLEEAGRFASGVLAPTNWLGDRKGVQVVDDAVQVPPEFTDAYARFSAGGWPGIAANPDFGGQGLPKTIVASPATRCGRRQHGLRAVPRTVAGRDPRARSARSPTS